MQNTKTEYCSTEASGHETNRLTYVGVYLFSVERKDCILYIYMTYFWLSAKDLFDYFLI